MGWLMNDLIRYYKKVYKWHVLSRHNENVGHPQNFDVFVTHDPVLIQKSNSIYTVSTPKNGQICRKHSERILFQRFGIPTPFFHGYRKCVHSFIYSLMIHIFKKYIRNCFPLSEGDAHQIPLYTSHEIP